MTNRIRLLLTSLASTLLLGLSGGVALAAAVTPDIQNSLCSGGNDLNISTAQPGAECTKSATTGTNFNDALHTGLNVFSIIVGIVAVIMIIIGGFRYITSSGNPDKVSGAKNTLIYAIVGLIIVALAQFIVRFVLSKSTGTG